MSASQRGAITLLVMLGVAAVFCYIVPFVLLPSVDAGIALPVIMLPGEILIKDVPLVENFTNTMVGILIAEVLVLILAFALRKPKMVPSGFQNFFEMIVEYLYNLTKQIVGPQKALRIFPLVASMFLVVLVANWLELVPGVDSIGIIHCAEDGMTGYPVQTDDADAPFDGGVVFLKVDEPLNGGTAATEDDYHACEAKWFGITDHGEDHSEEDDHSDETADHDTDADAGDDADHSDDDADHSTDGDDDSHSSAEEAHGNPDILIVTPFVRAAATDLNVTLSLALIGFLAIQFFGTQELGMSYYTKFINLPALGNLGKRPLGLIDFVVGILEIISELAKILSFGFRLFGNIFAGQVLLFVMAFLMAGFLPTIFYGLELFVGLIQAFVFFMLTLVFSGMAMEGHHGDDDHGHGDDHHGHDH